MVLYSPNYLLTTVVMVNQELGIQMNIILVT